MPKRVGKCCICGNPIYEGDLIDFCDPVTGEMICSEECASAGDVPVDDDSEEEE